MGTREGMLPQKCANSGVGYTVGQTPQTHPWAQQTRASSWQSLFYYLKWRLVRSELPFTKVFGCSEKKKKIVRGEYLETRRPLEGSMERIMVYVKEVAIGMQVERVRRENHKM